MTDSPIFDQAQRQWEEAPEGGVDWLAGKKLGYCPWCGSIFVWLNRDYTKKVCICHNWDPDATEDANRARYAREQQDADDAEERAFRNAIKFRWEEF